MLLWMMRHIFFLIFASSIRSFRSSHHLRWQASKMWKGKASMTARKIIEVFDVIWSSKRWQDKIKRWWNDAKTAHQFVGRLQHNSFIRMQIFRIARVTALAMSRKSLSKSIDMILQFIFIQSSSHSSASHAETRYITSNLQKVLDA